jgi:hypothetical protein
MAPIHQYGQANYPRSSEVTQGVQRGPHRTSGIEHIIDQHHRAAFYLDR